MAKKRFKETVDIRPVDTRTGQAGALMSLADRLEAFKNLGAQTAQVGFRARHEAQAARGTEEAKQVQLRGPEGQLLQPEFKEETFLKGTEQRAFNETLRASYIASLDNDNREAFNDIYNKNSDNLIQFNAAIKGYAKGVVGNVDPYIRDEVAADLERTSSIYRTKVQGNQYKKQKKAAQLELLDNVKTASNTALSSARNGDIRLSADSIQKAFISLDAGVKAGFIDKTIAAQQKKQLEREATEQRYLGNIDTIANDSIPAAFQQIEKDGQKVPAGFTPDEWRGTIIEAHQNVARRRTQKMNALKGAGKELDLQESIARGEAFMNPAIPADPAMGSQDRKDVNNFYDHVFAPKLKTLPLEEQFNQLSGFMKNTGLMPKQVISDVSAVMRSGTPDQTKLMTMLVDRTSREPNGSIILKDLPAESEAASKQIVDLTNVGVPIEEAMEIARKNVYGLTEAEKEINRDKIREVMPDMPKILTDMVDRTVAAGGYDPSRWPFMGEEPEVTPALQADFDVAFRNYMMFTNANVQQSQELSFKALGKKWGVWKGDFMKYSPDRSYGIPDIDNEWIDQQYDKDIKGLVKMDESLKGIDPEKTILAVDFEVANSDRPQWPIFYIDEKDKQLKPLRVKGKNVKWNPDFTKTREYTEMRARPEKIRTNVVKAREKIKQLDAELWIDPTGKDIRKLRKEGKEMTYSPPEKAKQGA